MPENTTNKRRGLATRAINAAQKAVEARRELAAIEEEAEGLVFLDSDFENTDLQHVNAYQIDVLINQLGGELEAWFDDPTKPLRNAVFFGVLR
jgi:hypothetical protein